MQQCWRVDELIEAWTLDPDDLRLIANKTGATRLGFAVLLKFFELEARFPFPYFSGRNTCRGRRFRGPSAWRRVRRPVSL
jgi:hypothetical protein